MTPITLPYHLLIPGLICLVLLMVILIFSKRIFTSSNKKSLWVAIISFLLIYIIILGSAIFDDIYCQWDLNKYDLNMNGIFEDNEINPEQEAAFQRLINDTGRNFAIFTGLIISVVLSSVIFLIGLGFKKYRSLKNE